MVILIKSIKHEEQYRIIILAIIFFAANLSLKAFFYGQRVDTRLEGIGPADASGSNLFALLLVGIIPFIIPFILKGKLYEKIICWLSLPLILNAFILCNSRGSFVALILSVMVVLVFMADKQIRKSIIILIICFIPIFFYLADDAFINRLSTLVGIEESIHDESEIANISSGRTEIWLYGLEMAKDYPLGAGPNGFKNLARFYMPDEILTFHDNRGYGMRGAHNTYLQVLVEQGFVGLFIYFMICIQSLRLIYKGFNYSKDNMFWKYNFLALGISFLSVMAGNMFSGRIYYEYFWWQVAIIIVAFSFVKPNGRITVNLDRELV
jgi:O-antigen ligase